MRWLALLAVFLALPAWGTDRYIAPTGHDCTGGGDCPGTGGNDCTNIAAPCKTLIRCYNVMAPGETCYLSGSTDASLPTIYTSPASSDCPGGADSCGNTNGWDFNGATDTATYGFCDGLPTCGIANVTCGTHSSDCCRCSGGTSLTAQKTFAVIPGKYAALKPVLSGWDDPPHVATHWLFTQRTRADDKTYIKFTGPGLTIYGRPQIAENMEMTKIVFRCPGGDSQGNISSVHSFVGEGPGPDRGGIWIHDNLFIISNECGDYSVVPNFMHMYSMTEGKIENNDLIVDGPVYWPSGCVHGGTGSTACKEWVGQGIGLKGINQDSIVRNNFIKVTNGGSLKDGIWYCGNQAAGPVTGPYRSSTGNNKAYQNIVVGATNGLSYSGCHRSGYDDYYNNTVYGVGTGLFVDTTGSPAPCPAGSNDGTFQHTEVFNNIFASTSYRAIDLNATLVCGSGVQDQDYWDFNDYFGGAGAAQFYDNTEPAPGPTFTTLAAWKTAVGTPVQPNPWQPKEQGSRSVDPTFVDAAGGNFHLAANSPLRDVVNNHGRGGGYDSVMGAYVTGNEVIGCTFHPLCHSYGGVVASPAHIADTAGVETSFTAVSGHNESGITWYEAGQKWIGCAQNQGYYAFNQDMTLAGSCTTGTCGDCGGSDCEGLTVVGDTLYCLGEAPTGGMASYDLGAWRTGGYAANQLTRLNTWNLSSLIGNTDTEGLAAVYPYAAGGTTEGNAAFIISKQTGAAHVVTLNPAGSTFTNVSPTTAKFYPPSSCGFTDPDWSGLDWDPVGKLLYWSSDAGAKVCAATTPTCNGTAARFCFKDSDCTGFGNGTCTATTEATHFTLGAAGNDGRYESFAVCPSCGKTAMAWDGTSFSTYPDLSAPVNITQCNDGIDNDGDCKCDYSTAPDCATTPACPVMTHEDASSCDALTDNTEDRCGDNYRDPTETCDGTDLAGQTCELQGYDYATAGSAGLLCDANCHQFNVTNCNYECMPVPNPGVLSATADSDEPCEPGGPSGALASMAVDPDTGTQTYWHTHWDTSSGPTCDWGGAAGSSQPPHWLITDLGSAQSVCGISYRKRSTGPESINEFSLDTCVSGGDCGPNGGDWIPLIDWQFPFTTVGQDVTQRLNFQTVANVRYVRMRVESNYTNGGLPGPWTVARDLEPRIANTALRPCKILSLSTLGTSGSPFHMDVKDCPGATAQVCKGVTCSGQTIDASTSTSLDGLLSVAAFSCSDAVLMNVCPDNGPCATRAFTVCGAAGQAGTPRRIF